MAFKYPSEGTVILGAAQCQHLIAVALVPPCPRALEPHMTNECVRRFNPPHCPSDSPLDATAHSGSDPDGPGDTPSNCQSLCALLQRRAACASTHPGPIRLSQGRAESGWL